MKLINCIRGVDSCVWHVWNKIAPRHISCQMTEDDILYLQDLFLTNGMHAISVPDVKTGRSIMHSMLQSLNYYQMAACMTRMQTPPLEESITDICSQLARAGHELCYEEVEHFYIEEFFGDFLWIEFSPQLVDTPLLAHSFHALNVLEMFRKIPIIALSYV